MYVLKMIRTAGKASKKEIPLSRNAIGLLSEQCPGLMDAISKPGQFKFVIDKQKTYEINTGAKRCIEIVVTIKEGIVLKKKK